MPLTHLQIYSTPGSSPVTGLPSTTIMWSASVGPCTYLDGSVPNSTGVPVSPSGSATPSPAVAGTYLFNLTCGSGAYTLKAATLAYIPVNAPTTLTASAASALVDAPVTLTWSSANGICYATGGDGTAPWTGTLGGTGSGSLIVTETSVGTVTYSITCAGAPPATAASTSVVFVTAAAPPPVGGPSHGGGSLDVRLLLLVGVPVGVSLVRVRSERPASARRGSQRSRRS